MRPPDLLHLQPRSTVDRDLIADLLKLAFMGREVGDRLDRALGGRAEEPGGWRREFFVDDLFLAELVEAGFSLTSGGKEFRINTRSLVRLLSDPPITLEGVRFRQGIVRELDRDAELFERLHALYRGLAGLAGLLRLPGQQARIDINVFRLDVLKQAKGVIDAMADGFGDARSGLRRLHEAGVEIRGSREYGLLAALLDWERRMSTLNVDIRVGAGGRITGLAVNEVRENRANRFYRSPWRRLRQRVGFFLRGYSWEERQVVGRLVEEVFAELATPLTGLLELVGQLELYLTAFAFRERARAAGLELSLARLDGELELEDLFNPLLLGQLRPPVPCTVTARRPGSVTIVTGPNSGGKTRLLQSLGLAQLLGQGGLFVPAARARLPLLEGLFVSLIQREAADQSEGRLGRELLRIRAIFQALSPGSMVIFDELCSGTNPSEGIEVFSVVLRLLERVQPVAFICTHFLDYARELAEEPPIVGLDFLQVEVDAHERSTYQFVPGVADTSLAAAIARRLGLTFDEMAAAIDRRLEGEGLEAVVGERGRERRS